MTRSIHGPSIPENHTMNRILRAATRPHWMATLLMCAALSACGGSDDNAGGGNPTPSGGAQTPAAGSGDSAINQPPAVKPTLRCAP